MESPILSSGFGNFTGGSVSSNSRSSTKLDDVTSLTSFNPFSEEDENDQSSYALVSSLFSRVKNTFASPLTSAAAGSGYQSSLVGKENGTFEPPRRPSIQTNVSNPSSRSGSDRPSTLNRFSSAAPAPPLVSVTPVTSEAPSFNIDYDRPPSRGYFYSPVTDAPEGGGYGTAIPGFPIQDDARSIRTTVSLKRSGSVSKKIRRIRGEGLSRDYWMDDELCKECYDCKSVFTAWRRKHHCRICGQVFCSRCASNIIKGSRFGQGGMVRVCNLCLEKLSKVDDEDDDDRRSVISSTASPFTGHQLGGDSFSLGLGRHSQSPFAASQLFGRKDEPFNLFSIAETKRQPSASDDSHVFSRGSTPEMGTDFVHPIAAPFRRTLAVDETDPIAIPPVFGQDHSPSVPGSKTPIDFPITVPISADGAISSVMFPASPPDHGGHPYDTGDSIMRSRFNSYGDFDMDTPFIRSRVQSRIPDSFIGEPGWRTRRESTAYAQELNLISMFHLRIMLRQMLTTESISNIGEWEETLLKVALRIARDLTFTAHPQRQGAEMDVRNYVKIKKIPGGAPRDSEFVDGAVITKNVAHKAMSRLQHNPRVMLVTFPLGFHRVEGQYMHFGQIVRQEKEYLTNLATRIAALRPHVVLVEASVSGIALDALAQHKIGVARMVKGSAIDFVARMTQADVFSSMDKLALEPRLGHCTQFRIQTFDHALIPGRRKTYMRFEGCNREMGCTILLRGGDIDTLTRIKRVTRFLTFIVRNLKLETHLWKDSVITLPNLTAEATPQPLSATCPISSLGVAPSALWASNLKMFSQPVVDSPQSSLVEPATSDYDLPDDEAQQRSLSRRIQQSVDPYTRTFISVSATLRFPPPQPIWRMKELNDELIHAKRAWEDEVIRREEKTRPTIVPGTPPESPVPHHAQEITITQGSDQDDIKAQIESLPSLPRTPTPENTPIPTGETLGYFDMKTTSFVPDLGFTPPDATGPRTSSAELPVQLKTVEDIALESRLSYLKCQHEEQRRVWEWYLRKNKDDFVVEKYQCITLWESTMPMAEFGFRRACIPPRMNYVAFYGENDCTLGQFIESSVMDTLVKFLDPKAICPSKGCDQPVARHCKVFVHNDTRLMVAVEQWDGQIVGRSTYVSSPELITTWSVCRVCGSATPFIPVSEEMQRYSLGKFLELHFYPADVQLVQGAGCQHNIYQHHIRYFAKKGMTLRFQADPVAVHEVIFPPARIRVRPEARLELKNADFERLHNRNMIWYTALIDDLKLISIDAATGDEEADLKLTADVNTLITRALREKDEIARLINQVYNASSPTDNLGLNQVRSYRQDKIVAWQQDFDRLPKPRVPQTSIDRNSRRTSAFGSVRAMWPRRYDLPGTVEHNTSSACASEAETDSVSLPIHRRVTGESFTSATSSASEASEPELDIRTGIVKKAVESPVTEPAVAGEGALSSVPAEDGPSSGESDSTIGTVREIAAAGEVMSPVQERRDFSTNIDRARPVSRLPRRPVQHPSVAELVKRYQEFLPPQGVHDLTQTAFAPAVPVYESDPETGSPPHLTGPRARNRHKHHVAVKKASTSDFEQGYAANVALQYPARRQRRSSRISVPPPLELTDTSRRTSPDKRRRSLDRTSKTGRASPPPINKPILPTGGRIRSKHSTTVTIKDRPAMPRSPNVPAKSSFRRAPPAGNKVSNIAKHYERINRENDKNTRRYAVIRGGRARPVASARAKVEILDSVKDAVKDESESSDSSSEADDEGDGDDESPDVVSKGSESFGSLTRPNSEIQAPPTESPVEMDAPHHLDRGLVHVVEELPKTRLPRTLLPVDESQEPTTSMPSPIMPITSLHQNRPSSPPTVDSEAVGGERHSILKALTGFWPQPVPQSRFRSESDAEDLITDPEHIFRDSSMVVRTDEPTSIIALALNSPLYREMLSRSRAEKRNAREPRLTDGGEAFMPDDRSVAESTSTWGVVNVESPNDGDPTEDLRVPSSKLPWAISFESSGLTISCTVLYPEQFDALRRTYDCEKSMIESLARCVKWNANGGKSGSAFLKTLDDRFIAKEISKAELQTMETFAPAYFDYMSSALIAGRPTLLAKIFGCFKVTYKTANHSGPGKPKITQMNLVVMENLFYDRRFNKIYDLKGSTRNRHVHSTGRENEVLLDENLNEITHLAPFYLREHSKRILRGSLSNDSKFLADINVMDYSFVVGVDNNKNELVVGIVDYIRTYTWDKKLESWVKESAFLGGAKGEPTIITPRQYRHRFLTAMERYFPLTPDRWMKQQDAPEDQW